jgi:hypothetical protein
LASGRIFWSAWWGDLLQCMSLLLAQSGHPDTWNQCPLSGVKRTSTGGNPMSAFDPKRTWAAQDCCCAARPLNAIPLAALSRPTSECLVRGALIKARAPYSQAAGAPGPANATRPVVLKKLQVTTNAAPAATMPAVQCQWTLAAMTLPTIRSCKNRRIIF